MQTRPWIKCCAESVCFRVVVGLVTTQITLAAEFAEVFEHQVPALIRCNDVEVKVDQVGIVERVPLAGTYAVCIMTG